MPLPTYYAAGTASVANGDTTVTFSGAMLGTEIMPNIMAGDLFLDPAQPEIPPQRIASIDYGAGTAELSADWPGATMSDDPYEVRYIGIIERSTAQNRRYLEMLGQLQALGIQPNAFGEFADREVYDDERKGFIFLSLSSPWTLYAKLSGDSADWDAGQPMEGAEGPQGERGWSPIHGIVADGARRVQVLLGYVGGEGEAPTDHVGEYVAADGYTETIGEAVDIRGSAGADGIDGIDGESFNWAGEYDNGTAYDEDDVVQHNGSSWIALQATTGNVPPTLPTTANDYWELVAAKGADGAGSGDVTAAANIADGALVVGDGGGKGIKEHPGGAPGSAAFADTGDFATAAQGGLAETAVQPGDLGTAAAADTGDFAAAAAGVPSGGTTGQVLAKASGADHDTEWVEQSGGLGGSTGSNDDRLLRSDGTGGGTVQASPVTVDDSGNMSGVGTLSCGGSISAGGNLNSLKSGSAAAAILRRTDVHGDGVFVATVSYEGVNDASAEVIYGTMQVVCLQDDTANESGEYRFNVRQAGANGDRLRIRGGLFHPSASGGDKGNNTINFGAIYDDNSLLTCMALQEEFLERGEIDLEKWDNLVPDVVEPESREEVPVLWPVQIVEQVAVTEPDEHGRLVRRVETIERTIEVPAVIADPVYDEAGNIIDAIETPLIDEIVQPERVIRREHRTARIFKAMIDDGFDPRDPEQYFAKMRADQALPGMPTQETWEHNGLSVGEQFSRKWLAMEMMAIVANVMWLKLQDHEDRIAALEAH